MAEAKKTEETKDDTTDLPYETGGPNAPTPDGKVDVTTKAKDGEPADPSGNVTKRKTGTKTSTAKKDSLENVDLAKLPLSVQVDEFLLSVEEKVGNPVLSFSFAGWVGDPQFKILASDLPRLEKAIAELRKQLA